MDVYCDWVGPILARIRSFYNFRSISVFGGEKNSFVFASTVRFLSKAMNSRELTLVSAAAVIGAFASAVTIRLFLNPKRRSVTDPDSALNGFHQRKSSSSSPQNPFDPSKRKGFVDFYFYYRFFSSIVMYFTMVFVIVGICRGMITLWRLHFYLLNDPRIQTGRYYSNLWTDFKRFYEYDVIRI